VAAEALLNAMLRPAVAVAPVLSVSAQAQAPVRVPVPAEAERTGRRSFEDPRPLKHPLGDLQRAAIER